MKKPTTLLTLAALATLSGFQLAHAQREAPDRNAARDQRRDMVEQMTPEQRAQFFENRFQERLQSATPEQRARMLERRAEMENQMRAQGLDPKDPNAWAQMGQGGGRGGNAMSDDPAARETQWRRLMNAAGITDKNTQDDLLVYIKAEEKAREPLLALARAAALSLAPAPAAAGATPVAATALTVDSPETEARISTAFDAYLTALAADKARHDKALQNLDVSVGYSTNPRLKAFLSLVGMLENNAPILTNPMVVFFPPRANGPRNANGGRGAGGGNAGTTPAATDATATPPQG